MDARKKRTITAVALITVSLALLALAVWLLLAHRPPMPQGPPPGGPFPGAPAPGGPGPGGRPPMMIEGKVAIISVMVVCMTLCVVAAVRLLKGPRVLASAQAPETISFKADYKTVTVPLGDIRYVESMSEYVKVYLDSQEEPLVVLYSLKRLEQELPSSRFIRIHRSYIVALDRVRKSSATSAVLDGDISLPVGASYRAAFRRYFPAR